VAPECRLGRRLPARRHTASNEGLDPCFGAADEPEHADGVGLVARADVVAREALKWQMPTACPISCQMVLSSSRNACSGV